MKTTTPLLCLLIATGWMLGQTVDSVITQARSHLGSEAKLNAVKAIQYEGVVMNPDGEEIGKITLNFQQPNRQRLRLDDGEIVETTAVNGYEGWRERMVQGHPERSGILVLQPEQVQVLIANVHENLGFFRGPQRTKRGQIELIGSATRRGKECWEVRFSYPGGLRYTRYFDKTDGSLVSTVTNESGIELVETGHLTTDGVRFPREVQTFLDGEPVRTVRFTEIKINQPLPEEAFDFPALPSPRDLGINRP